MKKLWLFWLMMGMVGLAHGAQDRFGATYPVIWRSSYTVTADTNSVSIASGSIIFHGIDFSSVTAGAMVTIFDNQIFTVSTVTQVLLPTVTSPPIIYDIFLSSGLMYSKTGTSNVNFLWDWYLIEHRR